MPRLAHGRTPETEEVAQAAQALADVSTDIPLAFAVTPPVDVHDFDFMFLSLQSNANNLLPTSAETVSNLKHLGRTMEDADALGAAHDSPIPAVYTYFGQFVDHDITLEAQSTPLGTSVAKLVASDMKPQSLAEIRELKNVRSATLDLDSLYGAPAPADPANAAKMKIGKVSNTGSTDFPLKKPKGKTNDNDLPRRGRTGDKLKDREALIGDPRNDENTIVAQLHLAFLKAHNALVDEGRTRTQARRVLRQHYQHIVVHDFLKRIVDPAIVNKIVRDGNQWFNALGEPFFMPLEFAVAGFRFGHTMIRGLYDFNLNFNTSGDDGTFPADVNLLFTFTALSGELGDFDTLPHNWIIEWERIVDGAKGRAGKARKFDTALASVGGSNLFALTSETGDPATPGPDAPRLAVRNLLRGYRLRMPTGQAVAKHLGLPVLTAAQLRATAINSKQRERLEPFVTRTPLWYYLLAEAKHHGGNRLGPVGGTIVAEVLVGLVRRSTDSILSVPNWKPSLPAAKAGTFTLSDLLTFAGVLGPKTHTRTYTVKSGDTLSKIAQQQLGNANRWPEIFLLNRATVRDPDRISVGQVLVLPVDSDLEAAAAPARVYVVKKGDTLSGVAADELGDPARWPEIFTLNRAVLTNPDLIVPDTVLVLPPG